MGYFRGGNISRMSSDAIIHEENFHECMAVTTVLHLLQQFHRENFHELSSIREIRENFPPRK